MTKLARYAWGVLGWNLAVIAWGAYVRATRSGAGCGAHWPLCNGEVIPLSPSTGMLVEFTHRASSGLALVSVAVLLAWTWRATAPRHPSRAAATWSAFFMATEAAVGAALVLFRLVADNASMARALFMSVHLVNTFLLIACLALTAYWLSGHERASLGTRTGTAARLAVGALAICAAGISGAVAALGDTLYPAGSLAEALSAELSATSHVLVRLRLFHPGIAVIVAAALILAGVRAVYEERGATRRLGAAVATLAAVQVMAGFANVLLLAPVWMQMLHLVIADALWICYVLLGARMLQVPGQATSTRNAPVPGPAAAARP